MIGDMKKVEMYETADGSRFDRANDAEAYELMCKLAELMTPPGFGTTQQDWKENISHAIELIANREKVADLMNRLLVLTPSDNFHRLKIKRPL
jgi:hypothetical protein